MSTIAQKYGKWAQQDSNTSAESREKRHISDRGAAKNAANLGDSPPETPPTGESEHGTDEPDAIDAELVNEDFAEAIAMLARLPLTDAERAEAVRRLLKKPDGPQGRHGGAS